MSDNLIIIPSYISKGEHARVLDKCVESIRATSDSKIVIVDDASPHKQQAEVIYTYLQNTHDNIVFYENEENKGFSATVNVGLHQAILNDYNAILVNADIEFGLEDKWEEEINKTDADIVGALLLYPNMIIQHAGIYFSSFSRNFEHRYAGSPGNLKAAQEPCECPVTGALQYIRHEVLCNTGVYDEDYRLGYEDVDFMIRAIGDGYKSIYNPKVKAIHHESLFRRGLSEKHDQWQKESYITLLKKHGDKNFYGIAPTMMESYE